MREATVVVLLGLYFAIVVVLAQGCVDQSDDSSGSGQAQTQRTDSTYGRSGSRSGHPENDDVLKQEPIDRAELAQQALDDISEAQVDQRTHDLKTVLQHLNEICAKAVQTCDALLSTPHTTDEQRQKAFGKDVDHGL